MKREKIEKIINIIFKAVPCISLLGLVILIINSLLTWNKIKGNILATIFLFLNFVVLILLPIIYFKLFYKEYVYINRETIRFEELTREEIEIVEDAKELIRKVDSSIIKYEGMKIYKLSALFSSNTSWYVEDSTNDDSCLFISFKKYLKCGKDVCFMAVLHEMLHAYNLRNSELIFKNDFLEGINQFFTLWLIENYSTKYKIPKERWKKTIKIGKLKINIGEYEFISYDKQVKEVQSVFSKYDINTIEAYLNYINMNPKFFREKIQESKYFIK